MSIGLATHINDTKSLSLAYCNLGLAYSALDNHHQAVRCQKFFLASSREQKNVVNICKALGNLGSTYMRMGDKEEGLDQYYEQIKMAEKSNLNDLKADCYHELAGVLNVEQNYDDAAIHFEKELYLRRQVDDLPSHYRALMAYAQMLEHLGKLKEAYKCYCEMSQLSKSHQDMAKFQQVCNLMGNVNIRMGKYEKAIAAFRLQLKTLNTSNNDTIAVGTIHVRISDCFMQLSDVDNAVLHLLEYQRIAKEVESNRDENMAYKKLSDIHELQGKFKESLMYSEKRLGCVQELSVADVCNTYADVASLHAKMADHDSAITYYEELLNISRNDNLLEFMYESFKGMGSSYGLIGNHENSLAAYNNAIDICSQLNDLHDKAQCYVWVANQYGIMGNTSEAFTCYENALSIAEEIESKTLKVIICGCLGKLHQSTGNPMKSKQYFTDAVTLSESLNDNKEKIKAYYRLGLYFYLTKHYEMARLNFQHVADLTEQDQQASVDYLDSDMIKFIISSYQMLQKVLTLLQKPLEALFVAEKANCINLECLLKQTGIRAHVRIPTFKKFIKKIQSINRIVLLYSLVSNDAYCWIIIPGKGFERFSYKCVTEEDDDNDEHLDFDDLILHKFNKAKNKINDHIKILRESLRVEPFETTLSTETDHPISNIEVIDRKENIKSQIGLPVVMMNRMVTSPTSPDLQFRYSRPTIQMNEFQPITDSWYSNAPLEILYDLFLVEADKYFVEKADEMKAFGIDRSISMVIPHELSLLTFALLKGGDFEHYFNERYSLSFSPSLFWLLDRRNETADEKGKKEESNMDKILVFGTHGDDSTNEAVDIARIFGCAAVIGNNYPKCDIVNRISGSTVCHLSTDVMWRSPSLAFPYVDSSKIFTKSDFSDADIDNVEVGSRVTSPVTSNIFVSVKDISELQFNIKLITLGISPRGENSDVICPEGLHLLVTALLMTGCKTVLTSLWPIPRNARKYFLHNFYHSFNRGVRAHNAYTNTIRLMQKSEHFHHPCNWSGIVIYGENSKLYRNFFPFRDALYDFLANPNRDVIKVILHLVSDLSYFSMEFC